MLFYYSNHSVRKKREFTYSITPILFLFFSLISLKICRAPLHDLARYNHILLNLFLLLQKADHMIYGCLAKHVELTVHGSQLRFAADSHNRIIISADRQFFRNGNSFYFRILHCPDCHRIVCCKYSVKLQRSAVF